MTVRPIIFSGPMIRALLGGAKTQTRRVLKLPKKTHSGGPIYEHPKMGGWAATTIGGGGCFTIAKDGERMPVPEVPAIWHQTTGTCIALPYVVGDLLYVREAWARTSVAPIVETIDRPWVVYRECDNQTDYGGPWKPSIHMPREFSRITLKVTGVKVERVQDISEEDAKAEGVRLMRDGGGTFVGREGPGRMVTPWPTAKEAFADLWDSINADRGYGWLANPWVVCVSFEVIKANVDSLSNPGPGD